MKRAIVLMFDSLNRHMLPGYAEETIVHAPNFERLAARSVAFDSFYAGSMPCMPARRELHTGRYNFLHRSWGPLEPFDDSMPQMLSEAGVHTHLASDHPHYWEDGGATYHTRYTTWEFFRGQEGDLWKGVVTDEARGEGISALKHRQEAINRRYMPSEAEHSQTRTVNAGLHFLETNVDADRWLLQIELFDPHEPFFTHQRYKDLYPHEYDGPPFDWPGYQKVTEPEEQVEHVRYEYAALVSMCDQSLGRILDFMDEHDMWKDTLLLVNTDHGFLLGEHGWWAKTVQPWFNELVHLPMYLWDPRSGEKDERCDALAQTIDIAPTVLRYFGLEPTSDMEGKDLARAREGGAPALREGALFGVFGGHANVTDGRYVYMRAPRDRHNGPLEEYTLMPTHMHSRFSVEDLADWEPAEPFSFTKGLRTIRTAGARGWLNAWRHGSLLFDLRTDPGQEHPLADDAVELRMLRLLAHLMHENDAPRSQFARLGIPYDGAPQVEHLLVTAQATRAIAVLEPLPRYDELPVPELLAAPLEALLEDPARRAIVERHAPQLARTELLVAPGGISLITLARFAAIPADVLRSLAEDLAAAVSG